MQNTLTLPKSKTAKCFGQAQQQTYRDAGGGFGGGRGKYQNSFGSGDASRGQGGQTIKDMSAQEIIDVISQEMRVWETSKMWPFSCFTYAKDSSSMSGFEDLSPEELRVEAYERQKNNTFQTYQMKVMTLSDEYRMKRQALRNPTPEMKQNLLREIEGHKAAVNKSGSQSTVFGQSTTGRPTTSGVFGNAAATPAQGLFGKPAAQPAPGLFAPNTSAPNPFVQPRTGTFGAPPVFGAAPGTTAQQTGGAFSNASASSVFGAPAGIQKPFCANPTASTSPFGQMAQQQPTPFGQTAQPQPGLFGKPAAPQPSGVFGNNPGMPSQQPAAQPAPTQGTGLFGKGPAAPAAPQGLFGKPAAPGTASPFGSSSSGGVGGQGQQQTHPDSVYTPLSQLTEEERVQFTAPKFVLGRIPTRPPPRELV